MMLHTNAFGRNTSQRHPRRSRRMRIRAVSAVLAVLSLSSALGACEGPVPQTHKDIVTGSDTATSASPSPDLTEDQEQRIRERLLGAIQEATDAKNTDGLDQSMSGPALKIRTAQIDISTKTGAVDSRTNIPTDVAQTIIPTQNGWPRTFFTITTTTEDQQTKRLLVMKQESATTNYKLWAAARLFPGAQLPRFSVPTIGSPMGEPDDSGLKLTPEQAVEQYADVLENGSNSEYAAAFADDYFRQQLDELTATVQEGIERNNGSQKQTFTVVSDGIAVIRSADGGDLVVAQIDSEWVREAGEGRQSLPASDAERALFGDAEATSTITVGYVNVIALYIPPANTDGQVTAVGAEQQPVSVTAG